MCAIKWTQGIYKNDIGKENLSKKEELNEKKVKKNKLNKKGKCGKKILVKKGEKDEGEKMREVLKVARELRKKIELERESEKKRFYCDKDTEVLIVEE